MTNSFEKYILREIRGKGRIIFEDFTDNTATCQIYQLNQGNLFGSLLFTKIDNKINEVMNFRRPFRFDGETTDGLKITAEQCAAFFTEIKQNGSLPVPLIISRIHTNVLKVYNPNKLENLEEGTDLCIEIGLLNYYSTATNFLINTEIGDIRSLNRLSNDDIAIFKNLHISYNTSVLRLKVKGEKNIEATKAKIFKVVDKILELTSFAVCTQLRWSYLSIFLNEFSDSQLVYYVSESRLPINPDTHYNIEESKIADFLSKSYINYTDQLITKYNFAIALKWYLDSMGLRYEVMRFISASTSLESILDSFSIEVEVVLPKKEFNELRKKIKSFMENEIGNVLQPDDLESLLKRIPEINRRSYRKKAEKLLESLGILDNHTREALKEIIEVRDRITHSGRFVDPKDKKKAARMYFELINILTKVFLKILVPDDDTFYQQYGGPTKIVE